MLTASELLRRIESYCEAHGVAESTFGRHAVNDGKLVSRLRLGKSITLDTVEKIERALNSNPPAPASANVSGAAA